MNKNYVFYISLMALITMQIFSPLYVFGVNVSARDDIILPTASQALTENGAIEKELPISKEEANSIPWLFSDVILKETRSQDYKVNYAQLALKRAIGYFNDNNQYLKYNDFFIVLNNGYIINERNYKDESTYENAKKTLLDMRYYRGDKLFTIACLSPERKVMRETYWKLIDTINLPAGSIYKQNRKTRIGIDEKKQFEMSKVLGINFYDYGNVDSTFAATLPGTNVGGKTLAKMGFEETINQTISKTFSSYSKVHGHFEDIRTIQHGPSTLDQIILTYQVIDNYSINSKQFNELTKDLEDYINTWNKNKKIIQLKPTSGANGIEVPTEDVYDVVIKK